VAATLSAALLVGIESAPPSLPVLALGSMNPPATTIPSHAVTRQTAPLSANGKASVLYPAARYAYAADPSLPTTSTSADVVNLTSSTTASLYANLVAAVGLPTGGSWTTAGAIDSYGDSSSATLSLSVDRSSQISSFSYEASTVSCGAVPQDPPLTPFDGAQATAWSDDFLTTLGYQPSTFTPAQNGGEGWSCGQGAWWDFSRSLTVNGAPTGITLSFTYLTTTKSLFSAHGDLATLGDTTSYPLLSPADAAQNYVDAHPVDHADATLPLVAVTLTSPVLTYGVYELRDGSLVLLPLYTFTATCSPSSAYCSSQSFGQLALDPSYVSGDPVLLANPNPQN